MNAIDRTYLAPLDDRRETARDELLSDAAAALECMSDALEQLVDPCPLLIAIYDGRTEGLDELTARFREAVAIAVFRKLAREASE